MSPLGKEFWGSLERRSPFARQRRLRRRGARQGSGSRRVPLSGRQWESPGSSAPLLPATSRSLGDSGHAAHPIETLSDPRGLCPCLRDRGRRTPERRIRSSGTKRFSSASPRWAFLHRVPRLGSWAPGLRGRQRIVLRGGERGVLDTDPCRAAVPNQSSASSLHRV